MNDTFEIVEKEIGNVAEIAEEIAMWKMPTTIETDLTTLYEYLKAKDQHKEMGMPYTRYIEVDWEEQMNKNIWQIFVDIFKFKWKLYIGIPTNNAMNASGNIKTQFIPNQKYLQTTHYGSYQKLGKTYKAIYHYAKEHKIILENSSFEFYQNNPKEVKPHELQTVVMVAIKG